MRKPRRRRKARPERHVLDIIFRQAKLLCPECGAELRRDAVERDHMTPLALDGEDGPENEWYICADCHKAKTKADIGKIAKTKRILKKAAIAAGELPAPRKAAIPGRPFFVATHEQILARRQANKLAYKRAKSAKSPQDSVEQHG
jgi:5-methylcytosine-specific restriction endonuclease McrA